MSTTIPCTVDTQPMANTMSSVSKHVLGTTAAVVTMQSAVIAAENAGASKVCTNVNRGFLTLMRSQISQKIANKQARVEALLMHLAQQKRSLLNIKSTMEREYERITSRYLRIFTSINKDLEHRISSLDQPVFELVNKHMATSTNRMNALTAWASTSQSEGLLASQQIMMSNMKHHAQEALEQSTDFLTQIGEQRILADQILISNPTGNEDRDNLIPVIITETVSNESQLGRTEIRVSDELSSENSEQISNALRMAGSMLPWQNRNVDGAQVGESFSDLLAASDSSERVKKMIRELYMQNPYQSF